MTTTTKLKLTKNTNGGGQFKIERGIPLPSRIKPNPYADIFSKMKAGDSFLIGDSDNMQYHAAKWRHENKDFRFAFRETNEGKRCWRVE